MQVNIIDTQFLMMLYDVSRYKNIYDLVTVQGIQDEISFDLVLCSIRYKKEEKCL